MESSEVKQKLIAQLIERAQKIIETKGRTGEANYIIVPDKNIEDIAKKIRHQCCRSTGNA